MSKKNNKVAKFGTVKVAKSFGEEMAQRAQRVVEGEPTVPFDEILKKYGMSK